MVPNANARHFLIKAKQRDLITAAGGQVRAAEICGYGKSTVGRWADPGSPEWMPLDALFKLEEDTGRHDLSEAIAACRGKRFSDEPGTAAANGSAMSAHAAAVVQMGELMTTGALAFADGKLTPAEATQIDRALSKLEEAVEEYRKVMAGARGAGGLDLVGKADRDEER